MTLGFRARIAATAGRLSVLFWQPIAGSQLEELQSEALKLVPK